MSRLTHPVNAYYRSLQMSRHSLFVFVEGKHSDPYFYGALLEENLKGALGSYQICRAHELPYGAGGKQALLKFYSYLKGRRGLVSSFEGKKTGILFFLDKDTDDLKQIKVRSQHICYTEYYSVENYIFLFGDIAKGISLTSSLETSVIRQKLGSEAEWRKQVAICWSDWIKICMFALTYDVDCGCGFGIFSRVNKPADAPVDANALIAITRDLQTKSKFTQQQFDDAYKNISDKVEKYINSGNHDIVFNGKWYIPFLEQTIKRVAGQNSYESGGVHQRIKSSVLSTLNFTDPWARKYKKVISSMAQKLGLFD